MLSRIDFGVGENEILAIVGEAGSGKSAICYAILGLLPRHLRRTSGHVLYQGRDLTALPERNLRNLRGSEIAMIVPGGQAALNPVETVGKQLSDVLRSHVRSMKKDQMRARSIEMLTMVGIPDADVLVQAYPVELSGGMAQRIVIAKALISSPRLLVADEFTVGLDVTIQSQILDLMHAIVQKTRSTTILTTSDLGIAANYADAILILRAGTMVEYASVDEFFAEPRHPYSAGLLDAARSAHRHALEQASVKLNTEASPLELTSSGATNPRAPRNMRRVGDWHFVLEEEAS